MTVNDGEPSVNEIPPRSMRTEFLDHVRRRLIGPSSPDEILREKPNKYYLTGMLFPRGTTAQAALGSEPADTGTDTTSPDEDEQPEAPTDLLFQKLPASVGLTFAISNLERKVSVEVSGSCYAESAGKPKTWKRAVPGAGSSTCTVTFDVSKDGTQTAPALSGHASLHVYVRRARDQRIATVTLINERGIEQEGSPPRTEDILFQVGVRCIPSRGITGYPDSPFRSEDPEAEDLALQYRESPVFAVGHGCSARWPDASAGVVRQVETDFMPAVEVPPVTTAIGSLPDSVTQSLSLLNLQSPKFSPAAGLRGLVAAYSSWADRLSGIDVPDQYGEARDRILERIRQAACRMSDGIDLLEREPAALEIFRKSNRAMLLAMARSKASRDRTGSDQPFRDADIDLLSPGEFVWRPFQIAFFLLSLNGLWNPDHADREIVDLIWFPTGGGKTEAYLAVAAFEIIRRRMQDERGGGTAVIKRYTLRLLTIQQFERAGGLVCAMETMRTRGEIPGDERISLGLWVGKDSSPNDHQSACQDLESIRKAVGRVEGVKVPLKRCPACGTPIIPHSKHAGLAGVGLRAVSGRLQLFCANPGCSFHESLPISFVDEELYDTPPTMLLGTVDKFAMLAWRDEARAFFGTRYGTQPPSLVIQDELHLISGPLGTLAGVYEAAIDTAISHCGRPAKYICATATIRRADEQIRKLYGRSAALFPPPGLSASDSYFSREERDRPGRLYVGSMGQGHTPTFASVIASSAILAAAQDVREAHGDLADTWWTLVSYHNSKRELGKTLSLARDDIPARLQALGEKRKILASKVRELSANLRDSEIPEALDQLAAPLPGKETLDFVACTNMFSVGVDVPRLGLMMINGQPKTIAEYIQASSRVGRDSSRPPGVILVLFSPTKPRDRSHYEYFYPFHHQLYRQVEPTSVTPFALPSVERGLHGAFVALVRLVSPIHDVASARRILEHESEVRLLARKLLDRIAATRDEDQGDAEGRLDEFLENWCHLARQKGAKLRYESYSRQYESLLVPFGSAGQGWPTLQSLRNVDVPLKLKPRQWSTGRDTRSNQA